MDYKTIMKENKVSFPEVYEKAITKIQEEFIDSDFLTDLREKRELGLKKYGEHSFQSSFENAIASPTFQHAKEELLDALNYISHEMYKNVLKVRSNDGLANVLEGCNTLLADINTLIQEEQEDSK